MLDKLTGKQVHYWIQLIALMGVAAGLPWSKIPLSIGTILLGLNLILKWDWANYWNRWKANRWLWLFFVYVGCEWLSLFWTSDYSSALADLRSKLPLYTLPLFITAIPLKEKKHIHWIALSFLTVLLVTSLINFFSYKHWIGNHTYNDIRGMSLFVSHIRYSIMIVFGIVLLAGWFIRRYRNYLLTIPLTAWFVYYTVFSQVGTGYFVLAAVAVLLVFFKLTSVNVRWIRLSSLVLLILSIGSCIFYFVDSLKPIPPKVKLSYDMLSGKTAQGYPYFYDSPEKINWENGYPVEVFIAEPELSRCWNRVSDFSYYGQDRKGNEIRFLLIRYMSSKGLYKDSVGFLSMTKKDIRNVENGMGSIELAQGGLKAQLYQIRRQLEHNDNPNGQSLLERIEYLKAGVQIIKKNPVLGVGMGDVDSAFYETYRSMNTRLSRENQHTTHNQYLTTWISSGIVSFLSFLILWILLFVKAFKRRAVEWAGFALITALSFLNEDTLETQTGMTFVALFLGIFIAHKSLLYSNHPTTQAS
jgi:hypothetical protein